MTTNETYFFREPYHFDYLQTLFKTEFTSKNRLNIWSAAASYGEEAYSVSMLTQDIYPLGGWKIHATDISNTALEKAKKAEFDEYDFRMLPEKYMKKHVSASGKNAMFKLDNKTKQSVSFQQLNLLESFNLNSQFDIIMLRNVLIYFEMSNKIKVVKNVIKHLKPGGYFFISISESPLSRDICKATGLENLGKGIFKKGNG